MSEENVEIVRQPIAVGNHSRRRLVERLALRFPPSARAFLARSVWRLPPRSRLRRWALRLAIRRVLEASNRGDFEVTFAFHDPDTETVTNPELVRLGFEPVYRGREGRLRYHLAWIADWGEWQQEPEEVIDLGERVLILGQMKGSGGSSGAVFEGEIGYLMTISAGRLVREEHFRSHQEALEAAGLKE